MFLYNCITLQLIILYSINLKIAIGFGKKIRTAKIFCCADITLFTYQPFPFQDIFLHICHISAYKMLCPNAFHG